jgi:hypothetical protein
MVAPPTQYIQQTQNLISQAIANTAPGKSGIFTLWIDSEAGINAAVAKKIGDDVKVVAYFGKSWGKPYAAGVALQVDL